MFLTGASGFIFECILSTVATFVLGNSIEQFSVTISLMMLMMGLASVLQSRISDRGLIEKFLLVEISLAILGGFAPIAVYASYAFMEVHFILVQYLFVLTIGFLIGLEIPLILRLNKQFVPQLKSNIASIFSTDYVGAFIGAVIWVYVLLKYLPLTEISFLVAGINFAVAVVTYGYFSYHGLASRGLAQLAVIGIIALGLGHGYSQNRTWNDLLEQRFYNEPIVHSRTTRYQHIVMTARTDPTEYRLYINGNLQFSSLDEHIYHELLVHPAMTLAKSRKRVLILGGGDGLALREVLRYNDTVEVTLVDIDPGMIEFASQHDIMTELNNAAFDDARVSAEAASGIAEDPQMRPLYGRATSIEADPDDTVEQAALVHVYTVDADKMLTHLQGRYDVVLVDLPDPNSVELVKLYSREFYFKLHQLLEWQGVLAVQSTSPYHAKESFLCILRTIVSAGYEALPYHDNVPSFGDWGWILARNPGQHDSEFREELGHLSEFDVDQIQLRYITPEIFKASVAFGKNDLVSSNEQINTLMAPALLRFYLNESWNR